MISRILLIPAVLSLAAIPLVRGADFQIIVGGPGGVVAYNPPSVNASVGDTVTFVFQQKNHTVTQSSFADPCTALDGGFDSGFIPVGDDVTSDFQQAQLTIQNTNPIWGFCRQAGHCQKGMVFAINPQSDAQFQQFQQAATGNTTSTSASSAATSAAAQTTIAATGGTVFTSVSVTQASATASATSAAASSTSTSTTSSEHRIVVGSSSGATTFTPANITAQPGDVVTFEFHAKNHTATQSSFGAPCRPLAETSQTGQVGFDSGFMPVAANATTFPTYTVQVNDSAPIWVFCAQTGHCGKGMVFAVNALESSTNTFEAFQARAISQNGTSGNSTSSTSSAGRIFAKTVMNSLALAVVFGIILGIFF